MPGTFDVVHGRFLDEQLDGIPFHVFMD
jgi:hypothetical protein